ncbi:MAG: CHAP domain-containing protein [Nocardioides sp.]
MVSLVCLVPASSYADGDDYPYAGLGKCPLVPLPPKKPGTQNGQGTTHRPGQGPSKPGQQKPGKPNAPKPPRKCAKHIWFYNGSYGDPWGFALRNCTSFVAWRLRMTDGLDDFENHFGGVHWGNASHWDKAAADLGYLVDGVPAVGAVAQTDDGAKGHVAWVEAVGDGTVTVEEYNYGVAGGYDVRTVPTSSFTYLHLRDLAPAGGVGSTRSAVATTDAHGGSWSARTTADGDLVVRRPSGRSTRLGAAGAWSDGSAPGILTDGQGRVWVAAVGTDGRVRTAHTGISTRAFTHLRAVAAGSATSSPALAPYGIGGVRVLAIGSGGTLTERHTAGSGSEHWSRVHRLGRPGSWSPQAAPATATDVHGRLWVAAVSRAGRLLAQHASTSGRRWSGFRPVDRHRWSVTSTPALDEGPDGRLRLASVGDHGGLTVRASQHRAGWTAGTRMPGLWSPYSSPALSSDENGRSWLAAVDITGALGVRWLAEGSHRWHRGRGVPHVAPAETSSPALVSTVDGVLVGARDSRGHLVWRRPLVQWGPPVAHGPHAGGFSVSRFL